MTNIAQLTFEDHLTRPERNPFKGYTFKSGKLEGNSIEQLALQDYAKLKWLINRALEEGWNPEKLWKYGQEILHKLNNFIPEIDCRECDNTATHLSIRGNRTYGYSVSTFYACCNEPDCQSSVLEDYKCQLYPIQFQILKHFRRPNHDYKQVKKVLLEAAGFKGRITKQNALEFLDNLVLQS